MNFNKIERDYDLDELSESGLRTLVREYQKAQDDNLAEFQQVKDEMEELEAYREFAESADDIDDLADLKEEAGQFHDKLTEELAEVSPLSEQDVADYSLDRKYELIAKFSDSTEPEEGEDGETEQDDETEFDDTGNRHETHEGDDAPEFVEETFKGISGVEP